MENKARLLDVELFDGLTNCPTKEIAEAIVIASAKMRRYHKILVCVSGGRDSDFVVDIMATLDKELYAGTRCTYVNVDPGLEYKATKEHLDALEHRYGIQIVRIHPKQTVAVATKAYGQPFCNKQVSEYISRLQKHGFAFEEHLTGNLDELLLEFPKCQSALEWWTNQKGENSRINIAWNKGLKEFLAMYPPYFKISRMCCIKSKEEVMDAYASLHEFDLIVNGVRKAEGGARSIAYQNCFTDNSDKDGEIDEFRPIFWLKKKDLEAYQIARGLSHSQCYDPKPEGYGLVRTGCAGCPFGLHCAQEIDACLEFEPGLYKVINNVFMDSITYTKMYQAFKLTGSVPQELLAEFECNRESYKRRIRKNWRQMSVFDM